jgi:parallel beta-helix repeat protein
LTARFAGGRRRAVALAVAFAAALAVAPAQAHRFAYVANSGSNNVSQYHLGSGGLLAPLSPPTVAATDFPAGVAVSPDGKSVYVAGGGSEGRGDVSQYDVGPGGALSPKSPATVAAGFLPRSLAVSPNGKSAYVGNVGNDLEGFPSGVSQYDVGSGGRLSPKSPASVPSCAALQVAVSPNGRSLYVAGGADDCIGQYDVGPGGALSPKSPASVDTGALTAFGIAVSPNGNSVYVANFVANSVSQYDVGPGGTLSPKSVPTVVAGGVPVAVAVSADGESVYVANEISDNVSQYDVGAGGALSPKSPATVAAGSTPFAVAVSPNGKSLYVANYTGKSLSQYDIGPGGALSPKSPATVAAGDGPRSVAVSAAPAQSKVIKVRPGDSIQAAVDQADPGDKVKIAPGTYTEASQPCPAEPGSSCAVVVREDDISIVGQSGKHGKHGKHGNHGHHGGHGHHGEGVVLKAADGQEQGISVAQTGDAACLDDSSLRVHGSLIKGLTVRGFEGDGVFLYCVKGWRVTHVVTKDNREYGIFPSHSFDGRVDHSFASGANDTGIYIGQSRNSRIDHNVATDNVSGYEIENSIGIRARHNLAHGNTGGILSFDLPFLDTKVNRDNVIAHNVVVGNNRPNTCLDPGDAVCQVPSGTGVLLVAADQNRLRHNLVRGNDSFGIAIANICVAQQLSGAECAALDIQRDSDHDRVVANKVTGNGQHPDPSLPGVFAKDLAWDTTGTGNCWSNNVFDTSFPATLPSC